MPYSIDPVDLRPIASYVVLLGAWRAAAVLHVLGSQSRELNHDFRVLASKILHLSNIESHIVELSIFRIECPLF